jgi:hypothetical protein
VLGQQVGQQWRFEHRRGQRQRHVLVARGRVGRTGDPFDDNGCRDRHPQGRLGGVADMPT